MGVFSVCYFGMGGQTNLCIALPDMLLFIIEGEMAQGEAKNLFHFGRIPLINVPIVRVLLSIFHICCCIAGPGPFEALANGCAFIQPKFSPPHSGSNTVRGCHIYN